MAAVQAAFPKGNPYVALRAEFGSLRRSAFCRFVFALRASRGSSPLAFGADHGDAVYRRDHRPQIYHKAIQAARHRQKTTAFKAQYALRAGVESTLYFA